MTPPILTFFNNKGGVGKTSLVYHLAWMYGQLGIRVLAVDLDPQANLTASFLDDDRLLEVWSEENKQTTTIYDCVRPLIDRTGDFVPPTLEEIEDNVALVLGDLRLSLFEAQLSDVWPRTILGETGELRVTSALWRIMQQAAESFQADVILVDVGPNLGAINRTVLISSDYVAVPLSPDLFSLQGLRNLGPTLQTWRDIWKDVHTKVERTHTFDLNKLPSGRLQPIGYIILQHVERVNRVVKAYQQWVDKIPYEYRSYVLQEQIAAQTIIEIPDPNLLGRIRHYRSLSAMAQEARKPIFLLKPADGAAGSHVQIVQDAYTAFEELALHIAPKINLNVPSIIGR